MCRKRTHWHGPAARSRQSRADRARIARGKSGGTGPGRGESLPLERPSQPMSAEARRGAPIRVGQGYSMSMPRSRRPHRPFPPGAHPATSRALLGARAGLGCGGGGGVCNAMQFHRRETGSCLSVACLNTSINAWRPSKPLLEISIRK